MNIDVYLKQERPICFQSVTEMVKGRPLRTTSPIAHHGWFPSERSYVRARSWLRVHFEVGSSPASDRVANVSKTAVGGPFGLAGLLFHFVFIFAILFVTVLYLSLCRTKIRTVHEL